jgi:hypothetical protein
MYNTKHLLQQIGHNKGFELQFDLFSTIHYIWSPKKKHERKCNNKDQPLWGLLELFLLLFFLLTKLGHYLAYGVDSASWKISWKIRVCESVRGQSTMHDKKAVGWSIISIDNKATDFPQLHTTDFPIFKVENEKL